jgi:RimJ/RimL family protein N-acetyltransferase
VKEIFSTKRLLIREFELSDSAFIIELLNMPEWIEFIGNRNIYSNTDAENYIDKLRKKYTENNFGFYLVELKNEKISIGMCGIIKRENLEFPDIGFAFLKKYCGVGYATEAAFATLNWFNKNFSYQKISAIVTKNNFHSIRLLEKIGFRFSEKINYENEELLLYLK